MELIIRGMKSDKVKQIQVRLKELGFFDREPTGFFGELTEDSVRKFQAFKKLVVDGKIGEKTWKALFVKEGTNVPDNNTTPQVNSNLEITAEEVKQIMPKSPLKNIQKYWPGIVDALKKHGLWYRDMILMALGTIYAETEEFLPIDEYISQYNTAPGGEPYALYDYRTDIGNNAEGDGALFKGRGFIQLTGGYNYKTYGNKIGVDLVDNPDRANEPKIAAEILVLFLKDKESKINKAIKEWDLRTARRLVNGGSHGLTNFIAVFDAAEEYDFAMHIG